MLCFNWRWWEVKWRWVLLYPVSPLLQQELQQLFVSHELPLRLASLCLTTTVSLTTGSVPPLGSVCVCVSYWLFPHDASNLKWVLIPCLKAADYKWTKISSLSQIICPQVKKKKKKKVTADWVRKNVFFILPFKNSLFFFFFSFSLCRFQEKWGDESNGGAPHPQRKSCLFVR